MKLSEHTLNMIAEETGVSTLHVKHYYDILSSIPCVYNDQDYKLLNCLYLLINYRLRSIYPLNTEDFDYILSKALYITYKDASIPYLSKLFIEINDINNSQTLKRSHLHN